MSLGLRLEEVAELLVLKGGNAPCLCSSAQLYNVKRCSEVTFRGSRVKTEVSSTL